MSTIRYALRRLWHDRSLTIAAVAVLAFGIGANTALFSVVDAVLLEPLPYPASDRLVAVRIFTPDFQGRYPSFPVNAAHFGIWRQHCDSCAGFGIISGKTWTMTGADQAELLEGATVNAGFFELLGIQPALGRTFTSAEEQPGSNNVAVIGHGFWIRRFGGDPGVLGQAVTLDGERVTIIGVLPAHAPLPGPQQFGDLVRVPPTLDVFRPIALPPEAFRSSGDADYAVVVRLAAHADVARLRAELDALEPDVSRQTNDDGRKRVIVQPLRDIVVRQVRGPLRVLFGATIAVLLIVCVNLTNLLLARQERRGRDAAIRTALGAARRTLVADTLIESLLLAAAGAIAGIGVAAAVGRIITVVAPPALPLLNAVTLNARVLLFLLVSAVAAALIVGMLPAVRSARTHPGDTLKANSYSTTDAPRGRRGRRALVAAQAGLGAALLVATGLLVMSFVRLMQADKGFDTSSVLTVDVALPTASFPGTTEQLGFYDAVIARLRAVPGVTNVAFTSRLPLRGEGTVNALSYPNDTRPVPARPLANYRYVTPEYFATIGTPLLRGRTFRETDRGRQVVILSASAASALWPGEDAVGKQVRTGGYLGAVSDVIGIAADTRAVELTRTDVLFTYLPYWLRGASSASLVLRTSVPPPSLGDTVRRAIREVDAGVAIPRVETMDAAVARSVADRRFQLELMIAFGGAAALLTAFGVFGVVSYSVARREREMGIRIALGAAPRDIRRLVLAEGVLPVAAGLACGLVLSGWIGSALAASLFAVRPGDPLVLGAATLTLLLATLAACAGPAIRAARISPTGSLRA